MLEAMLLRAMEFLRRKGLDGNDAVSRAEFYRLYALLTRRVTGWYPGEGSGAVRSAMPWEDPVVGVAVAGGLLRPGSALWQLLWRILAEAATDEGLRLNRDEAEVLAKGRDFVDCEEASEYFRRNLPGGRRVGFSGDNLLHEAYERNGVVFDPTAKQYVRPGLWDRAALEKAGLLDAVLSGAFTPAQHKRFMDLVCRTLGGMIDP
jgi:hypothetical protein